MRKQVVAGLIIGLHLSSLGQPALADHPPATYFPMKWKQDLSVPWRFTTGVPAGGWRDRITDGAQAWDALAQSLNFSKKSEVSGFPATRPCNEQTYQSSAVHWGTFDGQFGIAGRTYYCVWSNDSSRLWTAQIKFDDAETWWTSDSTPVGSGFVDLESYGAHEFGHAAGFYGPYSNGHFNPNGSPCDGIAEAKQTMCPELPYGYAYWRSLETHDKSTFNGTY